MKADAAAGLVTPATVRGVYLWAGDATIDLQRAKFPDSPVDEAAHHFAHTTEAARELARCGLNLAFLSMNWGFPPEREANHWAQFRDAALRYHDEGFRVIGYVQASNCLATGSYASRDWYALTPEGRTIPYFRRRLMTCWNHPAWIGEVGARALDVLDAGGDGVFFDNLWGWALRRGCWTARWAGSRAAPARAAAMRSGARRGCARPAGSGRGTRPAGPGWRGGPMW